MKFKPLSVAILPLSLGIAASPALAEALRLEEIIVTAQKREESLQEVPIAVSALSSEGLIRANVTRVEDLGNAISGILIENKGGYTVPKVRGVGTIIAGSGVYSAVATYVDDLYIARTYGNNLSIDSAESVQVLKGPQGALYGRNATSGAIVVKTKDPEVGGPVSGKFTVGAAEFNEVSISGRIESGLGDNAAFSLSGYYKDDDGKRDLISTSQRLDGEDNWDMTEEKGFDLKLVFEPSDNLRGVFKLGYSEYLNSSTYDNTADQEYLSESEITRILPASAPGGPLDLAGYGADKLVGMNTFQIFAATGVFAAFGFPGSAGIPLAQQVYASNGFGNAHDNLINSFELGSLPDVVDADIPSGGFLSREDTYASLNLNYNFDRFDLVSISGYRTGTQGSATDVGDFEPTSPGLAVLGAPDFLNVGVGFSGAFETEDFQQEFRLQSNDDSDLTWVVGAHYFLEESDMHAVDGNGFGGATINTRNEWSNESISIFGQATVPITQKWSFTLGGRYTEDEYELTDIIDFANTPPELLAPTTAALGNLGKLKQSEDFATYLARFEYQEENWMTYFGVSTGVKSGSLNNDGPAFGSAEPEELTSYEVGFKSEWLDSQLQFNGSLYHYDYEKPHIVFLDQASGGQQLLNASDATITGVDLDVVALVGENAQIFLNATILDSEYDDDTRYVGRTASGGGVENVLVSDGKKVAGSPDFTLVAGLDYRLPFIDAGNLYFSPSVKYTSGNFYDVENRVGTGGAGSDADDGYTLVNLNVRYEPLEGNWSAMLWVKNLTDEEYYSSGQVASGMLFLTQPGDPQQIGGSISYEF